MQGPKFRTRTSNWKRCITASSACGWFATRTSSCGTTSSRYGWPPIMTNRWRQRILYPDFTSKKWLQRSGMFYKSTSEWQSCRFSEFQSFNGFILHGCRSRQSRPSPHLCSWRCFFVKHLEQAILSLVQSILSHFAQITTHVLMMALVCSTSNLEQLCITP